jgi:hypothetical protein
MGIKRRLFDRAGVREYWLADPKALEVTVYRRMPDGGFPKAAVFSAGDETGVTTALLPGSGEALRVIGVLAGRSDLSDVW